MKINITKKPIELACLILFVISGVFPATTAAQEKDEYYKKDFYRNADFVYKDNIKTVLLHRLGFDLTKPIIEINSDEQLLLSFDDLDGDYKRYEYTVIHCDADWENSDLMQNEYLVGFTDDYINDYQFSVNTMQDYVHYELVIPNDVVQFYLSGNYILKVYVEDDPDDVLFTMRFMVFEPKVDIEARIKRPARVENRDYLQEVVFSIFTKGYPIEDPYRTLNVTIQQNSRWDNAITDLQPTLITNNELRYDHDGNNDFNGGNEFRYFNIKSLIYNSFRVQSIEYRKATGYQVYLYPDEVRRHKVYESDDDINGQFLISTENAPDARIESEYAHVHFFLPYNAPLVDGKLYLLGELTYWQFLREAELNYNFEKRSFEASMYLKQGYYNYEYAFLANDSRIGDVTYIEGNHFDTNNEYTFYIYYRPRGTRYDKLIAVRTFQSHPGF